MRQLDRPSAMLDLRLELHDGFRSDGPVAKSVAMRLPDGSEMPPHELEECLAIFRAQAAFAPLFWVSPELQTLVERTAASIPGDASPNDIQLPDDQPQGLVGLTRPLQLGNVQSDVFTFSLSRSQELLLEFLGTDERLPGYRFPVAFVIRKGDRTLEQHNAKDSFVSSTDALRVFMAFAALTNQRLVVDLSEATGGRPEIRRTRRAGLDVASVRVAELRRHFGSTPSDEAHPVDWSHRWLVSGHWRWQPYGPGRTGRRLTWIRPHVKGPEDKPFVAKETVRALVR